MNVVGATLIWRKNMLKWETDDIRIEGSVHGGCKVNFVVKDLEFNQTLMHKYSGETYVVEIKKKKEKRSLDANAYMWVLAGKISNRPDILMSKDEVYQKAIKDYGVSAVMPIKDTMLKDILRWHTSNGLGNSFDIIGACKNFEGYTNVHFYYGSSQYDTRQMAHLIDGIVAMAKDLDIVVDSNEVERVKKEWK